MRGTIAVRTMERHDLAEVARLCGQLGYPSTPAAVLTRFDRLRASPDHTLLVAIDREAVVGWIHLYVYTTLESDSSAEIGGLVVDERTRRRGIGHLLVTEAERWAKDRSCSRIRLRSNVLRADAHAFYERVGYRRLKTQYTFEKAVDTD